MTTTSHPGFRAGGIGLLTGLVWFLVEMTARIASSHFGSEDRVPGGYLLLLLSYCLVGLTAGVAIDAFRALVGRIARSGRVAIWTTCILALAAVLVFAAFFLRSLAERNLPTGAVARQLGVAALIGLGLAVVASGLVWSQKRLGVSRLVLYTGIPALVLLACHLLFLQATALERALVPLEASGPSERPNVLLVTIDTLRADRLGSYGYPLQTSPEMDRLAREGALLEQAIAHSPWTQPSFASILTATYPSQHGVFVLLSGERDGPEDSEEIVYQSVLRNEELTLAEILLDEGYSTFALQAICADEDVLRLDQGFQVYLCASDFVSSMWDASWLGVGIDRLMRLLGARTRRSSYGADPEADRVYRSFEALISRTLPVPFFAWINFRDPHSPYLVRQEGVPFDDALVIEALRPEDAETPIPLLSSAYDGEVTFVDHYVGKVIELLRDRGIVDETIVVLTSDHGEEFGDHSTVARTRLGTMRGRFHGHSLYAELLHVPWIFRYPPKIPAGRRIPDLVRHVDLLPTILDMVEIEPPLSAAFEGRSFLPLLAHGSKTDPPRIAYSERNLFGPQLRSIQDGRYKLILEVESDRVELYDLSADPDEIENLAGVLGHEVNRLRALLDRWSETVGPLIPPPAETSLPNSKTLEHLRALGYLP